MESQTSSQEELLQILNEELGGEFNPSQGSDRIDWMPTEELFTGLLSRTNSFDYQTLGENEDVVKIENDKYRLDNVTPEMLNNMLSSDGLPSSSQQMFLSQAVPIGHRTHYADCNPHDAIAVPDTTQSYGFPTTKNWPGDYHFDISFQEQTEKMTKSTSWTYSEQMDKLFVNMGVSCIVCFRVQKPPPPGSFIRAMPIFEKSDHIRSVVRRCPTHCLPMDPSNHGHSAPEHLVRCDSEQADYVTDPKDGRYSVVVPFMRPQAGTDSTQYLYKFMCLGSCVGGLNRRPLQLIFTLENNNTVLGRRALKVRICACPGRDRKSEENALLEGPTRKVKTLAQTTTADILVFEPASKRQKCDDELFTLTIQGRANYEVLQKVKESLELAALVPKEILQAYQDDQQEIIRPAATGSTSSNVLHGRASTSAAHPNEPAVGQVSSAFVKELDTCANRRPKTSLIRNELSADARCSEIPMTRSFTHIKKEPMELVRSWLQSINMDAYVDLFADKGYKNMRQLEEMIQDDVDRLPIGDAHRQYIWKALLDYRGIPSCSPPSQELASVMSNSQTSAGMQNSIYISRCKFKRVASIKRILPPKDE